MRVVLICIALVFVSSTLVPAARAQFLNDNENYRRFQSWAIDTQMPGPMPVMFESCIQRCCRETDRHFTVVEKETDHV